MAIEQSLTFGVVRGGQQSLNVTLDVEDDTEINKDTTLGIAADQSLGVALDISELKSLVIYADQNCTLETNSSSAPQETLTVIAGVPLFWHHQMPGVAIGDIFAGDVTNIFATVTVADTNIKIFAVLDNP